MRRLIGTLAVSLVLAACGTTPESESAAPEPAGGDASPVQPAPESAPGTVTPPPAPGSATPPPAPGAAAGPPPSPGGPGMPLPEVPDLPPTPATLGPVAPLGGEGVSPHLARRDDGGLLLAYASMSAGGTAVDRCTPDLTCTRSGVLDRAADLTVVEGPAPLGRRAYYVDMDPASGEKTIHTARIDADWTALTDRASLGISSGGALAWGVPDSVVTPDGRVRLYWVEPGDTMASERIVSATSTDATGTTFVRDDGVRLEGGYVDFEVLSARPGAWLAVMSSTPEALPTRPQGILLATSTDGLAWELLGASVAPEDMSHLDPTGVADGEGWLLVMARAPNAMGDRAYELVSARLELD